jgi:ATP phosphoribosyltransferase
VGKGSIDLGITGQDTILEAKMQNHTTELLQLGFGKCALRLQVPVKSAYKSAADLVGKRIVTSFEVLAGEWFKELDRKTGVSADSEEATKVEYVGGSVEAACALGLADGIGEVSIIINSWVSNTYPIL